MKQFKFNARLVLAIAALVLLVLFISAITVESYNHDSASISEGNSLCKKINGHILKKYLKKDQKNLVVEVYTLKKSVNMKKKDFELAVFFRDEYGNVIDSTWKGSAEKFEKCTINYFRYLKNMHVPQGSVTNAYTLLLDSSKLSGKGWLSLCTTTTSGPLQYTTLSMEGPIKDSCCRCPPSCKVVTRNGLLQVAMKAAYSDPENNDQ